MATPPPILDQLLATLRSVPNLRIDGEASEHKLPNTEYPYDARIDLQVGEHPLTLLVEAKKSIYPREVHRALWQLREYSKQYSRAAKSNPDRETQPLLIAESISPGAKDLLRAERVGYFDSGGSLFLPAKGAYLYIDKPPPQSLERSIRNLFSGRSAQVIHALLLRDRTWFGVTEIAKEARVSASTASEVLSQLDRFNWLQTRGQGPSKERQLKEPGALLDAWAKQLSVLRPPLNQRYYISEFKGDALLRHLDHVFNCLRATYAITSEAAAQRYAPFLTTVSVIRVRLLAGAVAQAAIADLGARIVTEGANVILLESKSAGEFLFRQQLEGIWLASPVQVYLDLLQGEGRSKELADHLRKERIKF